MHTYRVHTSKMASGDHEVHLEGCEWCPPEDQTYPMGKFASSEQALQSAKKLYPEANGCHHCLSEHYDLK